jgi:hypothetical protein
MLAVRFLGVALLAAAALFLVFFFGFVMGPPSPATGDMGDLATAIDRLLTIGALGLAAGAGLLGGFLLLVASKPSPPR